MAHTITTEDRVNEKGKFSALTEIADDSCVLVHFDDSVDVVTEWRDLTARHNEQLGIFGIKVPRHWKTQRAVTGVDWYQNIVSKRASNSAYPLYPPLDIHLLSPC